MHEFADQAHGYHGNTRNTMVTREIPRDHVIPRCNKNWSLSEDHNQFKQKKRDFSCNEERLRRILVL